MRRWIGPFVAALLVAMAAYQVALVATPRLLMKAAIARVEKGGGVNRFFHGPLATDKARAVVRPSPDLAYSSCPFDLSSGPVAISVVPVPARYWSLSVFDARTDVAFVRNNVESRGGTISIVLARAGQQVPAGAEVVRVDGERGIALIRILVEDRAAFAAIDAARRGSRCGPVAG